MSTAAATQSKCSCPAPSQGGAFKTISNALTSNQVSRTNWEGRDHLVAPVVLLVEGVHNGSQGPIYYPAHVLEASAQMWNGVPLPVFHPERIDPRTNQPVSVSGRSPEVIQERSVGWLFNVVYEASPVPRLKGELYLDVQKANRISPPVLEAVEKGTPLEVSTGLFSIDNTVPGVWNGENYVASVAQMFPDHLALLPGTRGACSWADGCGVRANEGGDMAEELNESVKEVMEAKPGLLNRLFGMLNRSKTNEASYEQKRRQISRFLDSMDSRAATYYLRAMFDDRVIYAVEPGPDAPRGSQTRLFQRGYTLAEDGTVTLADEVKEVREDLSYVEVTGNGEGGEPGTGSPAASENKPAQEATNTNNQEEEEPAMAASVERKQKVNTLIANGSFTENDREMLEGCSCESFARIEALSVKEPATPAVPTANASQKSDVTFESLLKEAPKAIQDRFAYLENQAKSFRDGLITRIKANKSNKLTDDQLNAMTDDVLAATADSFAPIANYAGQGGGPAASPVENAEEEEPLELPSMATNEDK